jgi:hypothetical protein
MIDFSLSDEQKALRELAWGCSGITTSLANLFVDHSQIVPLEGRRRGIWGTKSLWGRVVTYPGA